MRTIYIRKKRSGNYEISDRSNFTHKFKTIRLFTEWYNERMSKESNTTWDNHYRRFKNAKIVKVKYAQSQTYFRDAEEILAFLKK